MTIRPGGPDIAPEQVVAGNQAEFGIDWLANLLSVREQGTPLVNIAQVFTNAGMREISWKESNINSPADLKGKKVGGLVLRQRVQPCWPRSPSTASTRTRMSRWCSSRST